jgi:trimeric autotransporter adhesin
MRSDGRRTQILTLMTVVLALIASVALSQAQAYGRDDGGAVPMAQADAAALADGLQPDGTLDPAARGTFDPQGMTLLTEPGGAPVFQPATSAITGTWDTRLADALPSSGVIKVVFVAPNGDLYVGGRFGRIAGITATSIARWDGAAWSALGTDRSTAGAPLVFTIAVDGDDVYVGGGFMSFGGVITENIARWDGQSWHAVGSGFGPEEPFAAGVFDLEVFQGELLITGDFTSFSGVAAENMVRWNGTTAIPVDTNGFSRFSMVQASHGVYINAEKWGFSNVLVWDGTTLAPLAAAPIRAKQMEVFADDLYLFGPLDWEAGDTSLKLVKWDGVSWTTISSALPQGAHSFAVGAQGLFVGASSAIYRWTAGAWQDYGACTWCSPRGVASDGLYVTNSSNSLFRYDGAPQPPITLFETAGAMLAARDGNVYVAPSSLLESHATTPTDQLFRFNPGNASLTNIWPYGENEFNFSYPTIAPDGTFYIASWFRDDDDQYTEQVFRYRNNTWQSLPNLPNIHVRNMIISGTDLLMSDGTYGIPHDIYRWNGASWSSIPGPTNAGEFVEQLFVFQGQIYIVTQNARTFLPPTLFLSRWTGSGWVTVGPEMTGWIQAVAVSEDAAYVGGSFKTADGSIRNIARWDGADLHAMGDINGPIYTLAARGSTVYAGGSFSQIDGCVCFNLGRWEGGAWEALGSGTNGGVSTIAVDGQHVYVLGGFSLAGDLPSLGMALWHEQHAQEPPPTITPTATATVTQQPPTATATATATQPTATPPTATPTAMATPPTATPTAPATPPTATPTATATAPTQTPAAAEHALFLPLVLR